MYHRKQHEVVLATIPPSVNVGAFAVSLAEVRAALAKKHTEVADRVTALIASVAKASALRLHEGYQAITKELAKVPKNIEVRQGRGCPVTVRACCLLVLALRGRRGGGPCLSSPPPPSSTRMGACTVINRTVSPSFPSTALRYLVGAFACRVLPPPPGRSCLAC